MEPSSKYAHARRRLAFALWNVGAVLTYESNHPRVVRRGMERGFKLKHHEEDPHAPLAPFFFNLRTPDNPDPGRLTPEIIDLSARCMLYRMLPYEAVVGVPHAGDPFANNLARLAGLPCIQLGKWSGGHGGKRHIAGIKGPMPPGSIRKVLVVDDLITRGHSKREAILNLREESFEVTDVMVLIDHEQGGREEMAKMGCNLHSVFTAAELLDLYVHANRMGRQVYNEIEAYRAHR